MAALFRLFIATTALLWGLALVAGTIGVFQGFVIQASSRDAGTYIYVQGKRGNIRRVKVTGAKVYYDDSVPLEQRTKSPEECLREPSEIKVTAEQGKNGVWMAQEIVIISIPRRKVETVLRPVKDSFSASSVPAMTSKYSWPKRFLSV